MSKIIVQGKAQGNVLKTINPINFLGAVDKKTGMIRDKKYDIFEKGASFHHCRRKHRSCFGARDVLTRHDLAGCSHRDDAVLWTVHAAGRTLHLLQGRHLRKPK